MIFLIVLVLVWALAGIFFNLSVQERDTTEGIYVSVLFGICILVCLVRSIFIVFTHFKGHPIKKNISSSVQITSTKA